MNELELFHIAVSAIESGIAHSDDEADTLAAIYLQQRENDEAAP